MTALPITANTGRLSTWEGKDPAGKSQAPAAAEQDGQADEAGPVGEDNASASRGRRSSSK